MIVQLMISVMRRGIEQPVDITQDRPLETPFGNNRELQRFLSLFRFVVAKTIQ